MSVSPACGWISVEPSRLVSFPTVCGGGNEFVPGERGEHKCVPLTRGWILRAFALVPTNVVGCGIKVHCKTEFHRHAHMCDTFGGNEFFSSFFFWFSAMCAR
jgi:hypothetical protein